MPQPDRSLKHFLADEYDRAIARKRGGGCPTLDFETAEGRYRLEPPSADLPDRILEQEWAPTLLDRALARLRREFAVRGRESQFELYRELVTGDSDRGAYRRLSTAPNISEAAAKVAVHRLRR